MFPTTDKKNYLVGKLNVPFEKLSESYLRAETVLLSNGAAYSFNLQLMQGVGVASAQQLKQNDLFIVTHISILLKKMTTTDITDNGKQGAAKLYNYPNPSIFAASNEAANLEAIYNGKFSVTIDRTVVIPALDCRNFLRIPDAQAGQINAAIAGPVTYTTPRDGFASSLYGFYPTDVFVFDGQQTIDVTINLAGAIDLTAANQTNYVVCICKGYLAQDQAKKVAIRNV